MKSNDLLVMPAVQMEKLIRQKKISPVEIMQALFVRIHELNPKLNAYLTLDEERAMEGARQAEAAVIRKDVLKPLHGLPISIKDLINTKGIRTTYGSLVYKDFIPEQDAIVAERVRQNGAIIIGKTNTPEFGRLTSTSNRLGDDCRNPWGRNRIAGGSSGGAAAAVAAGLGPLAVASDGGGSIRLPAALCGVYGLKPTYGRIPQSWNGLINPFTCIGAIARNVGDAALMLSALAGNDPRDPVSMQDKAFRCADLSRINPRKMRIGFTRNFDYPKVTKEVTVRIEEAVKVFEALGFNVEEAVPPKDPANVKRTIDTSRLYAHYGGLLKDHADELASYVKWALSLYRDIGGHDVYRALSGVHYYRKEMADFFAKYDAFIIPTTIEPAPEIGTRRLTSAALINMITKGEARDANGVRDDQQTENYQLDFDMIDNSLTEPFNITGQPAATIPCGFSSGGLPVGMQIIGRYGEDCTVLRVSAAYEKARPWQGRVPSEAAE
jgi:Asp-tRNA(Asn)/Glu-tRNA(Gln) amidotransferase A subunit family amidase